MILLPDRYLSPFERAARRRRVWLALAAFLVGLIIVSLLDQRLYFLYRRDPSIEHHDWYRALRVLGYVPTWLAIWAVIALGPGFGRRTLGWLPALSAGLSGLAAEVLKVFVGRQRPLPDGTYAFKPFLRGFVDGSNLGMPSSHAAVAFGGAFMLGRVYPELKGFAIAGALACGLTRLWMGAHFTSDVYVGAGLGYAIAWMLAPGRDALDRGARP